MGTIYRTAPPPRPQRINQRVEVGARNRALVLRISFGAGARRNAAALKDSSANALFYGLLAASGTACTCAGVAATENFISC